MTRETDVAVVGVAGRFPDAPTAEELWENVAAGRVAVREHPVEAFAAAGVAAEELADPAFVRVAATLPGSADFASEFFGYAPAEADVVDPSQRLFLEACWEALERAGHRPDLRTGVFASGGPGPYSTALQLARLREAGLGAAAEDLELTLGSGAEFMAARIAYKLGLTGPTVAVQTACSSSLVAVHYASLSLLAGECDTALAGGASVNEPLWGYRYVEGGVMSRDGYCRAFDARSSGTSPGAGVAAVVLRRLDDAIRDRDPILAVVRGSAVSNDGAQRSGFTAPSPAGLARTVTAALAAAEVSPLQLRYVEAHGSGTALGDSLELWGLATGLREALGSTAELPSGYCGLGTVKANVGHCGVAAGIAGFVKALGVLRSGMLPPHPLFEAPRDPGLLADSPFRVPQEVTAIAAEECHVLVSSMGLGGTNAVAVLAPPPETAPARVTGGRSTLLVSARNRRELDGLCRKLADHVEAGADAVEDVAHTLRIGRVHFEERRVVAAPDDELAAALRLPRPPAARTSRTRGGRCVVAVVALGARPSHGLRERLSSALHGLEWTDAPPDRLDADTYVLSVVPRAQEADGALRVDELGEAAPDELDAALTKAWLEGVDVDWSAIADPAALRVPLPTYPFARRRHWALDRLDLRRLGDASGAPRHGERGGASGAEQTVLAVWRTLFGIESIGVDDEFGRLGGTSLMAVRMAVEIQQRLGVQLNLHRAGGSRATVRRVVELVRAHEVDATEAQDGTADGDLALVERDLAADLGARAVATNGGTDVLLTGATGFLGAFLLNRVLATSWRRVWCVVRAADVEAARRRLGEAAARYSLPAPDHARVGIVLGDLRDVEAACERYELGRRVGHVLHCAARVVFTEPYRVLRDDNVLPVVGLVRWMRRHGVEEFSFVSSLAATGRALGTAGAILETREQPLDPEQGGYGVGKWVAERILERAERDGMHVRIFRPGLILAATRSGACNPKDLIWRLLASGVALGAYPLDERPLTTAPVDVVASAVAALMFERGSAGKAYHLVDAEPVSPRRLFESLRQAGVPLEPQPIDEWHRLVGDAAATTGNELLASMVLYERAGHELDGIVEAEAWQPWLRRLNLTASSSARLLRRGLAYLRATDPVYDALLRDRLEPRRSRERVEPAEAGVA